MEIRDYREEIDRIDDELLILFKERMEVSRQIAFYKKEHGLPAMDAAREKEKLAYINGKVDDELDIYAQKLFETIFEISRSYQESVMQ